MGKVDLDPPGQDTHWRGPFLDMSPWVRWPKVSPLGSGQEVPIWGVPTGDVDVSPRGQAPLWRGPHLEMSPWER